MRGFREKEKEGFEVRREAGRWGKRAGWRQLEEKKVKV